MELLTISVDKFVRNSSIPAQAFDSNRKIKKIKNEALLRSIKAIIFKRCFYTYFVDKIVRKRTRKHSSH